MKMKFPVALVLAATLAAASCSGPRNTGVGAIEHVVLIGLDGWGAYSLPQMDMPTVQKFMDKGVYSDRVRSVLPSSSAVNWASMFMGAGPELHGYTEWDSATPDLEPRAVDSHGFFPTIFALLHDQRPESTIACFYEWDGIGKLFPKDVVDKDVNIPSENHRSDRLAVAAADYLRTEKPTLMLVAFDDPDAVGHRAGHGTPEYYAKLTELDYYIEMIEHAAIDAGIYDKTLFVIAADHGGTGRGHGGKTMEEMQVPLIFYGAGVKGPQKLERSIMQYDNAATIAYVLGLDVPQVWVGRPVTEAFE